MAKQLPASARAPHCRLVAVLPSKSILTASGWIVVFEAPVTIGHAGRIPRLGLLSH